MKITYDAEAKAVYIYLTDIEPYRGVSDNSQELTDDVLADWTKDGTLWGIEVLNVESKPLVLSEAEVLIGEE